MNRGERGEINFVKPSNVLRDLGWIETMYGLKILTLILVNCLVILYLIITVTAKSTYLPLLLYLLFINLFMLLIQLIIM